MEALALPAGSKRCTKCGVPKPADREHFTWTRRDGVGAMCRACHRVSSRGHYEADKASYKGRAKERRRETREFIRSLKHNKKCVDCKKPHPYWRMDFDHLDGKVSKLSSPEVGQWSMERILAEVAKCELVCSNCHRDRTHFRQFPDERPQ